MKILLSLCAVGLTAVLGSMGSSYGKNSKSIEEVNQNLPDIRVYHLTDTTNVLPDTYLRLKSCVLQVQAAHPGYKFVGFVYVPDDTPLLECAPQQP